MFCLLCHALVNFVQRPSHSYLISEPVRERETLYALFAVVVLQRGKYVTERTNIAHRRNCQMSNRGLCCVLIFVIIAYSAWPGPARLHREKSPAVPDARK